MEIIKFKINENYSEFEWAYKTAKRKTKNTTDNSKKRDYLNLFVRDSRNINSLNEYLLEKNAPKNKYNP